MATISGCNGGEKTLSNSLFAGDDRTILMSNSPAQVQIIDHTDDSISATIATPGILDITYDKHNDKIYYVTGGGDLYEIDPQNSWTKTLLHSFATSMFSVTYCNLNDTIYVLTYSGLRTYKISTTQISDNITISTVFSGGKVDYIVCEPDSSTILCIYSVSGSLTGTLSFDALSHRHGISYIKTYTGYYLPKFCYNEKAGNNKFYALASGAGGDLVKCNTETFTQIPVGVGPYGINTIPNINGVVVTCGDEASNIIINSEYSIRVLSSAPSDGFSTNVTGRSVYVGDFDYTYYAGSSSEYGVAVYKNNKYVKFIVGTVDTFSKGIIHLDNLGLIVNADANDIDIIDIDTNEVIHSFIPVGSLSSIVYCNFNNSIYYTTGTTLRKLDPITGSNVVVLSLPLTVSGANAAVYDDVNNKLVFIHNKSVTVVDVLTESIDGQFTTPASYCDDSIAVNGKIYFTTANSAKESIIKIDSITLTYDRSWTDTNGSQPASITFDGKDKLYMACWDYHLLRLDINTDKLEVISCTGGWGNVSGNILCDKNGNIIIVNDDHELLEIHRFKDEFAFGSIYADIAKEDWWLYNLAYNPNTNLVYGTTWDKYVGIYDPDTLEYKGYIETSLTGTGSIVYSHLDKKIYVGDINSNKVSVIT
jgi:hypothetical protein